MSKVEWLLEVLESVIFLETFLLWSGITQNSQMYAVLLFIVSYTNTALPNRMLHLCMFTLHNFHEDMFSQVSRKLPRGVHMWPVWGIL
jgi:hypothetical protein